MSPEDLFPIRKGDVFVVEATAAHDYRTPTDRIFLDAGDGASLYITPYAISGVVRRGLRPGDLVAGPGGIFDGEVKYIHGDQAVVLHDLRLYILPVSALVRRPPPSERDPEITEWAAPEAEVGELTDPEGQSDVGV